MLIIEAELMEEKLLMDLKNDVNEILFMIADFGLLIIEAELNGASCKSSEVPNPQSAIHSGFYQNGAFPQIIRNPKSPIPNPQWLLSKRRIPANNPQSEIPNPQSTVASIKTAHSRK